MSIERADERRSKKPRKVKVPGQAEQYSSRAAVEIARELRAKSELGRREARLAGAEAKIDGKD
jgi:hypothetical protein